jgi:hypothetical protein
MMKGTSFESATRQKISTRLSSRVRHPACCCSQEVPRASPCFLNVFERSSDSAGRVVGSPCGSEFLPFAGDSADIPVGAVRQSRGYSIAVASVGRLTPVFTHPSSPWLRFSHDIHRRPDSASKLLSLSLAPIMQEKDCWLRARHVVVDRNHVETICTKRLRTGVTSASSIATSPATTASESLP